MPTVPLATVLGCERASASTEGACFVCSAGGSASQSMPRAHGLIKKIHRTHRYELTVQGQTTITTLHATRNTTPIQLAAAQIFAQDNLISGRN